MITVIAPKWVPPLVQGLVRDLRVRWALEEAGLPYQTRLISRDEQTAPAYRELQPFGQVPVYEEDGVRLFETGAIVLHIADRAPSLGPRDADARTRMIMWMFAALNSVEPRLQALTEIDLFAAGQAWAEQRRPAVLETARGRLQGLAASLGEREYLDGPFSAADLLMTTVLRIPRHCELVASFPALDAYRQRCEARPAFQAALASQMDEYAQNAPPQT